MFQARPRQGECAKFNIIDNLIRPLRIAACIFWRQLSRQPSQLQSVIGRSVRGELLERSYCLGFDYR